VTVDHRRVESFIYREARLMDENAYDEWLSLWAKEALYWVPLSAEETDAAQHISIIYDDRTRLESRIARLRSGYAYSQDPKSRMCRVVSNIEIEEGSGGEIVARSNFVLGEVRRGQQDVFIGRTIHKLRSDGDSFRILFKKVLLVNSSEFIDNLTFLV
jgi:3-phenylpropionate/cinnamic acid dioxygenase small subunit